MCKKNLLQMQDNPSNGNESESDYCTAIIPSTIEHPKWWFQEQYGKLGEKLIVSEWEDESYRSQNGWKVSSLTFFLKLVKLVSWLVLCVLFVFPPPSFFLFSFLMFHSPVSFGYIYVHFLPFHNNNNKNKIWAHDKP